MATSNIEKQAFGQAGGKIVNTTGAQSSDFCAISFITDGEFSSLTWAELDPSGSDGTGITFPAGFVLYGQITGFALASGVVVVYNQA